jgi:hypothetical protein
VSVVMKRLHAFPFSLATLCCCCPNHLLLSYQKITCIDSAVASARNTHFEYNPISAAWRELKCRYDAGSGKVEQIHERLCCLTAQRTYASFHVPIAVAGITNSFGNRRVEDDSRRECIKNIDKRVGRVKTCGRACGCCFAGGTRVVKCLYGMRGSIALASQILQ